MLLWEKKNPGMFLGSNVEHLWQWGSSSPKWQLPASAAAFYWHRQPWELGWAELFIVCLHHKLWKFPFQCSVTWVFFEKKNRQQCLVVEVIPDEAEWLWGCYVSLCMSVTKKKIPPTKPSRTLNSCPFLMGTYKSEVCFGLINRTCKYCSFFLTKLTCCMPVSCNFILVSWLGGLSRRQGEGTLHTPVIKFYVQQPIFKSPVALQTRTEP